MYHTFSVAGQVYLHVLYKKSIPIMQDKLSSRCSIQSCPLDGIITPW